MIRTLLGLSSLISYYISPKIQSRSITSSSGINTKEKTALQRTKIGECFVVGIAGGTASGKTTLAKRLQSDINNDPELYKFGLNHANLIEQDCYYKNRLDLTFEEREKIDFDHPDAINFDQLFCDMKTLKKNRSIDKPIYSFATHAREKNITSVDPAPVLIVEGILILTNKKIRHLFDMIIYVDAPDDERILRRIERDIKERNRTLENVVKQYLTTVKPRHKEFVEPTKHYAHLIVPGTGDVSVTLKILMARIREEVLSRNSMRKSC